MGQTANELFALAEAVILRGNPNAVTDGAVAAMNARAAVRGAFLNVKINLGSIKDALFVEELKRRMAEIEADVDAREQALLQKSKTVIQKKNRDCCDQQPRFFMGQCDTCAGDTAGSAAGGPILWHFG